MTKLLVTGFGPFPRVPRNPSALLARALGANRRFALRGIEIRVLVLDTAYRAVDEALRPAIAAERPDAVLMLGVAARRRAVSVEARAVNRVSRLFPDASGRVGSRLAYRAGAPHQVRTPAPVEALLRALRSRGLAARRSIDAGRYLCNASSFAALHDAGPSGPLVVFVHVPLPRRDARRDPRPSLREMERGLAEAALALARAARRARV